MIQLIQTLISGLSLGSIYALIALGYTMVYGIAKMLNFAHGDIIMIGAYAGIVTVTQLGLPPVIAIVLSVAVCALLGMLIEHFAYKPLRQAPALSVLITAIGVSYLLQSLAQMIFGSAQKMISIPSLGAVSFKGVTVEVSSLVTLGASVIVMAALSIFVKYSKIGRAMIAVSEDRGAAALMGINVNTIITVTFAIGSALAGLAGAFYLMKSPSMYPTFGAMPGIKAFTAAVIGGIGSIPGAMVGSILLGIIECICDAVPPVAPYKDAIEFSILIVILLVRPSGLMGKKRREKV